MPTVTQRPDHHQDAAADASRAHEPAVTSGRRRGAPRAGAPGPQKPVGDARSFVSPLEGAVLRRAPWLRSHPLARPGAPYVEAEVYFALDGAKLGAAERETLGRAGGLIGRRQPERIDVDGYADVRGAERYNDGLSERRVDAAVGVLDASVSAAAAATICGLGHGEGESGSDHDQWRKVRVSAQAAAVEPASEGDRADNGSVGGPRAVQRSLLPPEVLSEQEIAWRATRLAIYERHLDGATRRALRGAGIPPKQVLDAAEAGLGATQIDALLELGQKRLGVQLRASSVPAPQEQQPFPAARMSDMEVLTYELLSYRRAVLGDVGQARPELRPGLASCVADVSRLLRHLEDKARNPNRHVGDPFAGLATHERVEPAEGDE